jgi:hypothetical protein
LPDAFLNAVQGFEPQAIACAQEIYADILAKLQDHVGLRRIDKTAHAPHPAVLDEDEPIERVVLLAEDVILAVDGEPRSIAQLL